MSSPNFTNDFGRHNYWLGRLYDGSQSDIPANERSALARGFVCYLDALLVVKDEDGTWKFSSIVHEYAARALIFADAATVELVWQWVEKMIDVCGDDFILQSSFAEGFFDDLAFHESDWSREAENRVRDRIFRYMSDPRTAWVALEAWDNEFESFWPDFKRYLDHPLSANYRGPASRTEIEAIFADRIRRWEALQNP